MVKPHLEIILAAIVWGFGGILIKWAALPPTSIAFLRLAVPTVALLAFFAWKRTPLFTKKRGVALAVSGINVVRLLLILWGVTLTTVGNAWLIAYTWPVFAAVYGALFLGERFTRKTVLLLLVAFAGVLLVFLGKEFSFADRDFLGMTLVLLEAILYPLTVVLFKKHEAHFSNWEMVFYLNVLGAVVLLPVFLMTPLPAFGQLGYGLTFGVTSGIVGFALFYAGLKRMTASTASHLTFVEVVSALAFSAIFLGEVITWNMVAGGVLIVASVLLLQWTSSRQAVMGQPQ